jgi:type IV secretion system protein TrbL
MAILNEIAQSYQSATLGWYGALFPIANRLFGLLAVIEIAWSGLWWALEKQDISSLFSEFLKKIILIGFFYAVLLHAHAFLPAITKSFMLMGANASHISKLDPSSIFEQGMSIAASILVPLEQLNLLTNTACYLVGGLTSLIVAVCFAIIAGELVVTLIESYLVLGAGIFFLGFGSSRWTRDYTVRFLNYAMNVGCKLFFLYLIIGVGANMAAHWKELILSGGNLNMLPFLEVMGGALVYLFIAWTIPHKAANLMSGALHSNLSSAVASTTFLGSSARSAVNQVLKIPPASWLAGCRNKSK